MNKKILGLDLGTTSIGWAFVTESDKPDGHSRIERIGVRVNPLTTEEQTDFQKGRPVSLNADRTRKRGMRRNLQRYKQRRANLISLLLKEGIIGPETILAENEKGSTFATYALRSRAVSEQISKEEFARVLLMINKKRGYKSSRKVKDPEEGVAIDGLGIARRLYEEDITPGALCYQLLQEGRRQLPDFYRSDLQAEFDKVWTIQQSVHPDVFTDALRKQLTGKGLRATSAIFWTVCGFNTAENKGTREEKKMRAYEWRSRGASEPLSKETAAYVIAEINNNIHNSSGYLGAISDRSKELYFNKETVGQHLYKQLLANPHAQLRNQVFYRQDYLDEFEAIWESQAQYHPELTAALKAEIRDVIIFYQRKLKSQKGQVSFCTFESQQKEIMIDGKPKLKTVGYKVAPKSSPIFQEFKIWQNLGSLRLQRKAMKEVFALDLEAKQLLFDELNVKGNLSKERVLELLGYKPKEYELNFNVFEGNRTNAELYGAYLNMMELEGYDIAALLKADAGQDELKLSSIAAPAAAVVRMVRDFFSTTGINPAVLDFNAEMDKKAFEQQPSYQLWHLLYSYEGDTSPSGNELLHQLLGEKFGFSQQQAKLLARVPLSDDYGSLSTKALRKIFPHIKELEYPAACTQAGYNHSFSLSKEENEARPLKDRLALLPKNSLRNPVVEKILNQMVNVVNAIIDDPELGRPDEIRIELARELKKNAEERAEMTASINRNNALHEQIRQILIKEDDIKNPTRNDIMRYKLYQELKNNGYKTLYSNTYISREDLFSKNVDIEHIIPRALLFDDSYSNKTLCLRQENLAKGNACALEFVRTKFDAGHADEYISRVEMMYQLNLKNPGEGISKAKYQKLLKEASDIGGGFIERDLRDSQYIARKAKDILQEICRTVISTTGSITDRLREDWGLVNVMQELNMPKYRRLGLTEMVEKKDGSTRERIKDWTKRNDHRHHAMDALTVAFTKRDHIHYLNHLNARKNEQNKLHAAIKAIEARETALVYDDEGKRKRRFRLPVPNFREEAKRHLEQVLVSYKAKNKVVTRNVNRFKTGRGEQQKIELTPRGQLHKETVYGKLRQYTAAEERPGAKFTAAYIANVASPRHREALLSRLQEYGGDPKMAFTGKNSPEKNPVFLDAVKQERLPEKVKRAWLEEEYTIRKDITPENFKDPKSIEKVIDAGVRKILHARLAAYDGNAKLAFSNLDKNPIWLHEEKGIAVKRVTMGGVKNAEALHTKKDHKGRDILDGNGNKMPVDFVSTGNNHHVAVYRDASGNLQDNVVSFFEAVSRAHQGLPVINKAFNQQEGWQFLFTMKQNECFVIGSDDFDPATVDLYAPENKSLISQHLYRVQKFSRLSYGNSIVREYVFRHHLETMINDDKLLKDTAYKSFKSLPYLEKMVKVRLNHLGSIVKTGEY